MKNEETLITKLIEETIQNENNESDELGKVFDLSSYFEKRVNQLEFLSLKKYVMQNELNSHQLTYNPENKCYRLNLRNGEIDFPSNWSIFSNLGSNTFEFINRENDQDFLCDIFSEAINNCESFVLINDASECRLITFADTDNKFHVEWITNYFNRKMTKQAA